VTRYTSAAETPAPAPAAAPAGLLRRLLANGFVRFLCVGGVSFVVDAGTLWLLRGKGHVNLTLATAIAYVLGMVVNFVLNRIVTFASDGHVGKQGAKYLVLVGLNFVWTIGVVDGLSHVWHYYLASKTLATFSYSVVTYFAYRHWVFGQDGLVPRRGGGTDPSSRQDAAGSEQSPVTTP
jgi:putative flippase GtrA